MPQLVDCWDLDGTLVHTGRLFASAIGKVGAASGKSVTEVAQSLGKVSKVTFTFTDWFADLGIEEGGWVDLEADLRASIAARAKSCLYPGVVELLEIRKRAGVRQVLVTAGDPTYQQWKFELLGLNDVFAGEDRHFVPLDGSKATVIELYVSSGSVNFIDDRTNWLLEVADRHLPVRCLRPCWPETSGNTPHDDDGRLWQTATSIEQLQQFLERGAA